MKARIRPILEECIEDGTWAGMKAAHKHADEPSESYVIEKIQYYIWLMIDERFDFDRSLADEISEGLDALKKQHT